MKLKEHFQQVVDSGKGCWITDFIMYFPKNVQEKIKKVFPSHLKYLTCIKLKRINTDIILAELILEGINWNLDQGFNRTGEPWSKIYVKLANFNKELNVLKYLL